MRGERLLGKLAQEWYVQIQEERDSGKAHVSRIGEPFGRQVFFHQEVEKKKKHHPACQ